MFGLSRTPRRRTGDPPPVRSRRSRWRRLVLRRTAALLALAAALALTATRLAPDTTISVVASARSLPAGHVVTAQDLTTVQLPTRLASRVLTVADDAVGHRLAGPVDADEPLRPSRLTPLADADLPPGTAPVHVVAADPLALDLLHPGELVDVYVSAMSTDPAIPSGAWRSVTGPAGTVVLSIDVVATATAYQADTGVRGLVLALTREQARLLLAATDPGQPLVAHLLAHPS